MPKISWKKYRSEKVQETRKVNIGTDSSPKYINLGVDCTSEEVDQYVSLFKEYLDVFAWSYDDLKAYDKTIFQHIIPLREGEKPVKQKIRMMNPKLKPLVKIELEKLKKVGIIYPIRHSDLAFKSSGCEKKDWGDSDVCGF
jgi:hypothetical protein